MTKNQLTKVRRLLKEARKLLNSHFASTQGGKAVFCDSEVEDNIHCVHSSELGLEALVELAYRKTYSIKPEKRIRKWLNIK